MTAPLGHNEILAVTDKGPKPPAVHPYTGRNRAERRRLARRHGFKGAKAKKGVSYAKALQLGMQERETVERAAYVARIQEAAQRTRSMGLVIPGQ